VSIGQHTRPLLPAIQFASTLDPNWTFTRLSAFHGFLCFLINWAMRRKRSWARPFARTASMFNGWGPCITAPAVLINIQLWGFIVGVKIGKQVEDRLFQETENGCGVCGFKDARALTIHHIEHELDEIDNSYDNLIVLCHNCHHMYHEGKGATKAELVQLKRRLILKTLTPFGTNAMKIAYRKGIVVGMPFTLLHLVELGLLEEGEVISSISDDEGLELGRIRA
jgi:hypothetical protein